MEGGIDGGLWKKGGTKSPIRITLDLIHLSLSLSPLHHHRIVSASNVREAGASREALHKADTSTVHRLVRQVTVVIITVAPKVQNVLPWLGCGEGESGDGLLDVREEHPLPSTAVGLEDVHLRELPRLPVVQNVEEYVSTEMEHVCVNPFTKPS